ncbi:MAG: ABC-F family ATP-binding cassette domain-containing protein [Clostridiales bacterium]|nr:ABC-F family ATP-binding cassette domain-containing protein [Clostridiales bacterium]
MILVTLKDISKSYGIDKILEKITLTVNEGEKIGIVGNNGAGKSTLFNIMTGNISYDEGQIFYAKDLNIGYLRQSESFSDNVVLYDYCLEPFKNLIEMETNLRNIENLLTKHPHDQALLHEYSNISDEFNQKDGYAYHSKTRGVLLGLGFTEEDFARTLSTLSGGQKTRLNLAKLLLTEYDLLLLDEPTNHLDIESVKWLENYLSTYRGAVVIVSHDRYFLDKIVLKIYELEFNNGKLYYGNYSEYINQKRLNYEHDMKFYQKNQLLMKREEEMIRKFKQTGTEKMAKRAKDREHKLDKIEKIQKPFWLNKNINLNFDIGLASGNHVFSVEEISKSYSETPLFENISFEIFKGDKIGLIGRNGIGKSTLFKILVNFISPDKGSFTKGHHVTLGYYDQDLKNISDNHTMLEEIQNLMPTVDETEIRKYLGSFLFTGDDVFKEISILSGGEKSRLSLLKLMLSKNNFLMLDEPTNHLDIISRETLENALLNYEGTMFTISHDRYFLNKVCNKIFELEDDGLTEYLGNYDYYSFKKNQMLQYAQVENDSSKISKTERKELSKLERENKRNKKEARDKTANLENRIHTMESRIEEIHKLQCDIQIYSDQEKLIQLNKEIIQLENDIKKAYTEWENLL